MKVCVVFTGGTIGSVLDESGYIGPKEGTPYRLLELYKSRYDTDVTFEMVEPYRILSENLDGQHLEQLFAAVREVLKRDDLDGVIVTHGTDTLQFGAAMLGYVFGGSDIPIVLVSSNYVLEDNRANGLVNFHYALEFIKASSGKGVFVSYCNQGDFPTIHRATRLQPAVPLSDAVSSVMNSWYGRFENGNFIINPEYHIMDGQDALFETDATVRLSNVSEAILYVRPFVGMQYPDIREGVRVVLHGSYHSGTIAVLDELDHFVKETNIRNIPIYLTGLLTGTDAYETVEVYEKMGVRALHTSAEVAQYCKLWLTLSNGLNVDAIMGKSVAEDWV